MVQIRPDSEDLLRRMSENPQIQRRKGRRVTPFPQLEGCDGCQRHLNCELCQQRGTSVSPFQSSHRWKKEIHDDFSDFRIRLQHYKMETKITGSVCMHCGLVFLQSQPPPSWDISGTHCLGADSSAEYASLQHM